MVVDRVLTWVDAPEVEGEKAEEVEMGDIQ
jgi:hypothetical protein